MGIEETWKKKLAKASELHKEHKIIWFRRGAFHGDYSGQVPKWHVFKDRTPEDEKKYSYIWEARCGYRKSFDEGIFFSFPQLKLTGKPKKSEQCKKCLTQIGN